MALNVSYLVANMCVHVCGLKSQGYKMEARVARVKCFPLGMPSCVRPRRKRTEGHEQATWFPRSDVIRLRQGAKRSAETCSGTANG